MNSATVISTVSHGKLNREPRQSQPLPTVISTVSHGKLSRNIHGNLSRQPRLRLPFSRFISSHKSSHVVIRTQFLQLMYTSMKALVGVAHATLTSVCIVALLEEQIKTRGLYERKTTD
jgi:hypothetical protein